MMKPCLIHLHAVSLTTSLVPQSPPYFDPNNPAGFLKFSNYVGVTLHEIISLQKRGQSEREALASRLEVLEEGQGTLQAGQAELAEGHTCSEIEAASQHCDHRSSSSPLPPVDELGSALGP